MASAIGAGAALALPGRVWAALNGHVEFRIWRKGSDIGRHRVEFAQTAAGLDVESFVDIKVKLAFVTAFSFEQMAEDHWRDGILVDSRVETNDDGEHIITELSAQSHAVLIEGPKGLLKAPRGLMTDVCFWNPEIVGQRRLLDTALGEIQPINTVFAGEETLELAGSTHQTLRYQMDAKGGRSGDIWFDKDGRWVDGKLTTRGELLDYELLSLS